MIDIKSARTGSKEEKPFSGQQRQPKYGTRKAEEGP